MGFQKVQLHDVAGQLQQAFKVSERSTEAMQKADITIQLGDPMPDILLWNQKTDKL